MNSEVSGRLAGIYTTPGKGLPMVEHASTQAWADQGLEGDRYLLGTGKYSNEARPKMRQVTLIAREAIKRANETRPLDRQFTMAATRRNLEIEGLPDLTLLRNKLFQIGDVVFEVDDSEKQWEATPCEWPSTVSQLDGFMKAFQGLGGIRAKVRTSGLISLGDRLTVVGPSEAPVIPGQRQAISPATTRTS